jgi:hypothetical protein
MVLVQVRDELNCPLQHRVDEQDNTKKYPNGIFGFLTLVHIKIKDLSHMTPCSFADRLPNFVSEGFPSRIKGMGN